MNKARIVSRKQTRHVLVLLCYATAFCGVLVAVRCSLAGRMRFSGLFFNLLLAWIPVLLALAIGRVETSRHRKLWIPVVALGWLLFFPNAFYIVTDIIHMNKFGRDGIERWFDMLMTMACAFTGAFLGCVSLYLMQLKVRARFGWKRAWVFAVGMLALGSFGIYLGRFLRLNSWDVVTRPQKVIGELASVFGPPRLAEAAAFSATFFFFSLFAYCFVVSMTRFHEPPADENAL